MAMTSTSLVWSPYRDYLDARGSRGRTQAPFFRKEILMQPIRRANRSPRAPTLHAPTSHSLHVPAPLAAHVPRAPAAAFLEPRPSLPSPASPRATILIVRPAHPIQRVTAQR